MALGDKTPAQIETEKLQKEWEAAVKLTLNIVTSEIPKLAEDDTETRAQVYRQLLALRDKVAQCSPTVRKAYNKAVEALFQGMDAIPGSMFLDEEDPKP